MKEYSVESERKGCAYINAWRKLNLPLFLT